MSQNAVERQTIAAEELELPIVDDLAAIAWVVDALDQVVQERKGVALIGPKGSGKSMALNRAVLDFDETEKFRAKKDELRRVVCIDSPRGESRVGTIALIWKAIYGMEQLRKVRGKAKDEALLFNELIAQIVDQNIAALVFDEAEKLADESVQVIRDIVSATEAASKKRFAGQRYRAAGVGALLIGTDRLLPALVRSDELGHRWVRVQKIDLLEPPQVAKIYEAFLPAFHARAEAMGPKQWYNFIRLQVCTGKPRPIRLVENHVRNYVRRMMALHQEVESPVQVPWDEEMFFSTLREIPSHVEA